jgi:hypothetical protein
MTTRMAVERFDPATSFPKQATLTGNATPR